MRQSALLIALIFAASSLNYLDRQVLALLQPTLAGEFGWTNTEFGHLGSAFQFATAVAYLGIGWFIDRFGVRVSYALGVGFWSLAGAAHAFAATIQQFVIARIALALGETVNTPAGVKSAATYLPLHQRSVGLGVVNSAPNVGAIVTPLIVPPLALAFGWRSAFLLTGGLGLIWLIFWWLGTRKLKPIAAQAATKPTTWSDVLKSRGAWAFMGAKFLFDHVWWFVLFWAPAFFSREFGLSQASLGGPIAVIYSLAALGALSSGFTYPALLRAGWSANLARKGPMLIYGLLIVPILAAPGANSPWIAALIIGVALFAHQGFSTNAFALAADVVPQQSVGRVIAGGAFAGNISGMFIVEATGRAVDAGLGYMPMFALASVSYLIALVWIHIMLPNIKPLELDAQAS